MPAVTLKVDLPENPLLPRERLEAITARSKTLAIAQWLDEHRWIYTYDAKGGILVGALYANLRLAGLDPAAVDLPETPARFDMTLVR